jgi:hypothetical protein
MVKLNQDEDMSGCQGGSIGGSGDNFFPDQVKSIVHSSSDNNDSSSDDDKNFTYNDYFSSGDDDNFSYIDGASTYDSLNYWFWW